MYTTTLFDKPLILLMETHPKIACSDDVFSSLDSYTDHGSQTVTAYVTLGLH